MGVETLLALMGHDVQAGVGVAVWAAVQVRHEGGHTAQLDCPAS